MEIQGLIPELVLSELRQNHEVTVRKEATTESKEFFATIWK
jgi:hypothetical protein